MAPNTIRSEPFPHMVRDGLWDRDLLVRIAEEFPDVDDPRWIRYEDEHYEVKLEAGAELWGPSAWELIGEIERRAHEFGAPFGLPHLFMRPEGAGLHCIEAGGRLAVHADANRSDDGFFRRLNVIVFLNDRWTERDGGHLELWNDQRCTERVLPVMNRTVLFPSMETAYHGHPTPLPGPRLRKSVAVFFYAEEPAPDYSFPHTTVWLHAAPTD